MELRSMIRKIGEEIGIMGLIKEWSVKKLAEQIHDCVECHDSPRDVIDWLTAENFVKGSRYINFGDLVERHISEVAGSIEVDPPGFDYLPDVIRQTLQDSEVMNRCCGRRIWDQGYQKIKRQLPHPPYGRILFE
jgi:hypothetical protein